MHAGRTTTLALSRTAPRRIQTYARSFARSSAVCLSPASSKSDSPVPGPSAGDSSAAPSLASTNQEAAPFPSSSTSAQSLPALIAPPRVDDTSSSEEPKLKKAQAAKLKKVVNKAEQGLKPAAKASKLGGRAPPLNRVLPVFPRQATDKLSYAAKVLEQGRLRAHFKRKDDVWKGKEREHVPLDIGDDPSTYADLRKLLKPAEVGVDWQVKSEDVLVDLPALERSSSAESPTLKHSLDRVFFNPGPCLLQDSRSKVYNFDSDLAVLPIPSSNGEPPPPHASSSRYSASSDAILPALTQIWFALGHWRSLDMTLLPQALRNVSSAPSLRSRQPAVLALKRGEGGKYLIEDERPKTLRPNAEVSRTVQKHILSGPPTSVTTTVGSLSIRSEVMGRDGRLLNGGTFGLGVTTIPERHSSPQAYLSARYELMCSSWPSESFANHLAHNDGTLYTYVVQDTRFVGAFEYVSREAIDSTAFGSETMARRALKTAAAVLEQVLDKAVGLLPEGNIKIVLKTLETTAGQLAILIRPDTTEADEPPVVELRLNVSDLYKATNNSTSGSNVKLTFLEPTSDKPKASAARQTVSKTVLSSTPPPSALSTTFSGVSGDTEVTLPKENLAFWTQDLPPAALGLFPEVDVDVEDLEQELVELAESLPSKEELLAVADEAPERAE